MHIGFTQTKSLQQRLACQGQLRWSQAWKRGGISLTASWVATKVQTQRVPRQSTNNSNVSPNNSSMLDLRTLIYCQLLTRQELTSCKSRLNKNLKTSQKWTTLIRVWWNWAWSKHSSRWKWMTLLPWTSRWKCNKRSREFARIKSNLKRPQNSPSSLRRKKRMN